jgi:hypothetical protein
LRSEKPTFVNGDRHVVDVLRAVLRGYDDYVFVFLGRGNVLREGWHGEGQAANAEQQSTHDTLILHGNHPPFAAACWGHT